ncbi:TorF family putative porin [Desulfatiglans anilini]|uniref:TorF family putative porin n=1 Tax=Desulfatiglans anilini TaxID=90728 RepID=UPI0003FFF431|nr:TorF family putative porin [Desulfatiglans anilini]
MKMFSCFGKRMFILAVLLSAAAVPTWAEEEPAPTASADVAFMSQYIWRGYELSKDSLVIQPSVTVGYMGFSLNLWGNIDTDVYGDDRNEAQWNETDLTFGYERTVGPVNLGAGYIYYALDGLDDSQELYASAGLDVFLSPTLTIYREIAHVPAWYLKLGISHSFELPRDISLDLGASAGYYFSDDDDFSEAGNPNEKYRSLHDGLVSVGLTIPLGDYFSCAPMIAYSFPLSSEADDLITDASYSQDSDFFFGGVTFSLAF